MNRKPTLLTLFFAALATILVTGLPGCNTTPTTRSPIFGRYSVTGAVIADVNRDTTLVLADVRLDSLVAPSVSIQLGSVPLTFTTFIPYESLYTAFSTNEFLFPTADYSFTLSDSAGAIGTAAIATADTFTIVDVIPRNRLVNGVSLVSLGWTPTDRVESFVIAAVRQGQEYTGTGFSQYVFSFNTAGSIPAEAFFPSGGTDPDTGWYNLYVYALTGAPDSTLSAPHLPVPLPSTLPDNIAITNLDGRFGSIVVAARDSVRVALINP